MLFRIFTAIILLCTALMLGTRLCFTEIYFQLKGLHPFALEFIQGHITVDDLSDYYINGMHFLGAEAMHFADVKKLVHTLNLCLLIMVPLSMALLFLQKKHAYFSALYALYSGAGFIVFFALAFFSGQWKWLTKIFHEALFPQGNWKLPKDSLTIQLYPREVMQISAIFTILFACSTILLILMITKRYKNK